MTDTIHIEQLELSTHIGVPDTERAAVQRLTANLTLEPRRAFDALNDDIANTVDYFDVCQAVQQLAASRPHRLIETLATEIAHLLLARFGLVSVEVEIRKYILPDVKYTAVCVRRAS